MFMLDLLFNGIMDGKIFILFFFFERIKFYFFFLEPKTIAILLKTINNNKNMIENLQEYLFLSYLYRIIERNRLENN